MRITIVIVGIVLLVIGAVLLFVPVSSQAAQTVTEATPALVQVGGFSITGNIPVSISWTSTEAVEFLAASCSATCASGDLAGLGGVVIQSGTSGSFTINQPNGGEIVFGIVPTNFLNTSSSASATVNMTTALTTVGSILLIVGIIILIVGVVLRGKPKMAPMAPPMAEPAMGSMNPPPPSS